MSKLDVTAETMSDFLTPEHFDIVVEASLKCTGSDGQTVDMKHPSIALKLGYDVEKMASAKRTQAIKQDNEKEEREDSSAGFLLLTKREWPVRVSKRALAILDERRFNKRVHLPNPDDMAKISKYLETEILTLNLDDKSWTNHSRTVVLVQVRLATFNKRRPGELEAL